VSEVAGIQHKQKVVSDTWSLGCTVVNMASSLLQWADTDVLGHTNEFMAMWLTAQGKGPPYDASGWIAVITAFVTRYFEQDQCLRGREYRDLCTEAMMCRVSVFVDTKDDRVAFLD
jgi:hypothetical protein